MYASYVCCRPILKYGKLKKDNIFLFTEYDKKIFCGHSMKKVMYTYKYRPRLSLK